MGQEDAFQAPGRDVGVRGQESQVRELGQMSGGSLRHHCPNKRTNKEVSFKEKKKQKTKNTNQKTNPLDAKLKP